MSATDESSLLKTSVTQYLDDLDKAYKKFIEDAPGEEIGESEWKKAVAVVGETLPIGFILYVEDVVSRPLCDASTDKDLSQLSREKYARYHKLTVWALDAMKTRGVNQEDGASNESVRSIFSRALKPLLSNCYRKLIHAGSDQFSTRSSGDRIREELGELLFDCVMKKIAELQSDMTAAYDVDNNTKVAFSETDFIDVKNRVIQAVREAYVNFLSAINQQARQFYSGKKEINTRDTIQAVVNAYNQLFLALHESVRAYFEIKFSQFGGEKMKDCHVENTTELADWVQNELQQSHVEPLTDAQFHLLDDLSMAISSPFRRLSHPDDQEYGHLYGLFGALYSRLFLVVMSVQRGKYLHQQNKDAKKIKKELSFSAKDKESDLEKNLRAEFDELKNTLMQVAQRTTNWIIFVEKWIHFFQCIFKKINNKPREVRQLRLSYVEDSDSVYHEVRDDETISPESKADELRRKLRNYFLSDGSAFRMHRLGKQTGRPTRSEGFIDQLLPVAAA